MPPHEQTNIPHEILTIIDISIVTPVLPLWVTQISVSISRVGNSSPVDLTGCFLFSLFGLTLLPNVKEKTLICFNIDGLYVLQARRGLGK